jgi:hypothetical protein
MSRSQDKTLQSVAYHKRRALNKVQPVSQTKLSSQRKTEGADNFAGNIRMNPEGQGCGLESTVSVEIL